MAVNNVSTSNMPPYQEEVILPGGTTSGMTITKTVKTVIKEDGRRWLDQDITWDTSGVGGKTTIGSRYENTTANINWFKNGMSVRHQKLTMTVTGWTLPTENEIKTLFVDKKSPFNLRRSFLECDKDYWMIQGQNCGSKSNNQAWYYNNTGSPVVCGSKANKVECTSTAVSVRLIQSQVSVTVLNNNISVKMDNSTLTPSDGIYKVNVASTLDIEAGQYDGDNVFISWSFNDPPDNGFWWISGDMSTPKITLRVDKSVTIDAKYAPDQNNTYWCDKNNQLDSVVSAGTVVTTQVTRPSNGGGASSNSNARPNPKFRGV